jgi:hypothetical protein
VGGTTLQVTGATQVYILKSRYFELKKQGTTDNLERIISSGTEKLRSKNF